MNMKLWIFLKGQSKLVGYILAEKTGDGSLHVGHCKCTAKDVHFYLRGSELRRVREC